MSKNKSKIVRWEYVTKPFDVKVLPTKVKRVHSPLEPSLEMYWSGKILHFRPCVQGVDEYGVVVKYLYCTRDGRFFVRGEDGWNEILPFNINRHSKNPARGGGYDCPQLRQFGDKPAHRCVAVAWCNPPEEALAEINDKDAKKKWEVDHLNTDHKNWTADNLQWVTADENRRRGAIAKLMRMIGLDPKRLTPTLMRGIYTLPTFIVIYCLNQYKHHCKGDQSAMTIDAIRLNFAKALDDAREETKNFISTGEVSVRQQYHWLLDRIRDAKNNIKNKQQQ